MNYPKLVDFVATASLNEYEDRVQDLIKHEAWVKASEPGHKCGGWIGTAFDTWERCPKCPDRGHPEDDFPKEYNSHPVSEKTLSSEQDKYTEKY